jgi:hypothetical protein
MGALAEIQIKVSQWPAEVTSTTSTLNPKFQTRKGIMATRRFCSSDTRPVNFRYPINQAKNKMGGIFNQVNLIRVST